MPMVNMPSNFVRGDKRPIRSTNESRQSAKVPYVSVFPNLQSGSGKVIVMRNRARSGVTGFQSRLDRGVQLSSAESDRLGHGLKMLEDFALAHSETGQACRAFEKSSVTSALDCSREIGYFAIDCCAKVGVLHRAHFLPPDGLSVLFFVCAASNDSTSSSR